MPERLYGGVGQPVLEFLNGQDRILPEPIGREKEGLREAEFTPTNKGSYRSQGNKIIVVGEGFIFNLKLSWEPMEKKHLHYLFQAQSQGTFYIKPNLEYPHIKFLVRIPKAIKHSFFMGDSSENSLGYSVEVEFVGAEVLTDPGYGALHLTSGFGTGWGTNWGNQ